MSRKQPARDPQPAQLVFPFELRVGDVILAGPAGKPTGARPTARARRSSARRAT
jgi:hypothetical protein